MKQREGEEKDPLNRRPVLELTQREERELCSRQRKVVYLSGMVTGRRTDPDLNFGLPLPFLCFVFGL